MPLQCFTGDAFGWIKDKINAIRRGTGIGSKDDLAALEKAQKLWQDMYDVATARQNEKVIGKEVETKDTALEIKVTAPLSKEVNEFNKPFVLSSEGTTIFGEVTGESGLIAAPIKLNLGENVVDENGINRGYGLLHIEAEHGEQIRMAGFSSVEEFVEDVAKNYDTIREGNVIADNQTYLLEVSDDHNNTLFVQLSRDGGYWNVNSAGIFRKKYSRRKRKVASLPTIGNSSNTETVEVNRGQTKGATATSENSSLTSIGKDTDSSANAQGKWRKRYEDELRETKEWLQREHPGETITEEDVANEVDLNDESNFYAEAEDAVGPARVKAIAHELRVKQIEAVKKKLTVENVLSAHQGHYSHGDAVYDLRYFGFWLHESGNKKGKYDLTVNTKWHDGIRYRTRRGDAYGFTLKILIWNKELNTPAFYPNPSNLHQYNKM